MTMIKRTGWRYLLIVLGVVFAGLSLGLSQASAHGFVTNPGGRAYLGSSAFPGSPLNTNIGPVAYEPQSIEGFQNTFITGKIASAAIERFSQIDEQTDTRWYKTNITAGNLDVTWHKTAVHRTASWDYYITKPGWNPNAPLNIADFEKIATYDGHNQVPDYDVTHQVNIPNNKGYQILLSVWNVADTGKAFYQVSDINVQ